MLNYEGESFREKIEDLGYDAADRVVAVLSALDKMRILTQEKISKYLERILSTRGYSESNWK